MSKTALGRRLDSLMRKGPDAQASASPVQPIGRGLGTLLNGTDDGATTEQERAGTRASWSAAFANVPAWYFFAADILLLAIEHATVNVIPEAGHMSPFTHAAAVSGLIASHLDAVSSTADCGSSSE